MGLSLAYQSVSAERLRYNESGSDVWCSSQIFSVFNFWSSDRLRGLYAIATTTRNRDQPFYQMIITEGCKESARKQRYIPLEASNPDEGLRDRPSKGYERSLSIAAPSRPELSASVASKQFIAARDWRMASAEGDGFRSGRKDCVMVQRSRRWRVAVRHLAGA